MVQDLVAEAERAWPNQAFAFLIGRVEGDVIKVVKIVKPDRFEASTSYFKVDPIAAYKVFMDADREGLDVVGIFHTHHGSSVPSGMDLYYMKSNPCVWLIVAMPSLAFGVYEWRNGGLYTAQLVLEEG